MQKYKKEITEMLYLEIVNRYYYQHGASEAALKEDPCIDSVYKLFKEPELSTYRQTLRSK